MSSPSLIQVLQKNRQVFQPVVRFDPSRDKLVPLDFTEKNAELTKDLLEHTDHFIVWVNNKISGAGARYGIGGYGELRTIYSFSRIFDPKTPEEEPRRFHLGTDIWGKPQTAVMSPMDGIVHSFAVNNGRGDYGGTVILSHHLDNISFHTLYGHLSLNSVKNLHEGQRIDAGEVFADFGIPAENGQWPPHLHFQLIHHMEGWKGDYPGVVKFSECHEWLSNSPDPDLILQLNQYVPNKPGK